MNTSYPTSSVQIIGIIILIIGLALHYFVNRRRFNRRGAGGLQHYSTYGKAVVTTAFEKVLKLIAWAVTLFGIFLFSIEWFNHKQAEKHKRQQQEVLKVN